MRFFVTGPINYGYSRSVIRAIEAAKHEAEFYPMREFYVQASYWQRKLYKLGCTSLRENYDWEWESALLTQVEALRPDCVLVLNGAMLTERLLERLVRFCPHVVLWLWDGLVRFGGERIAALLPYLSCIAVFEYDDLAKLMEFRGKTLYLPLGYDEAIYEKAFPPQRDIDIAFVECLLRSGFLRWILSQLMQHREEGDSSLEANGTISGSGKKFVIAGSIHNYIHSLITVCCLLQKLQTSTSAAGFVSISVFRSIEVSIRVLLNWSHQERCRS